MLLFFENLLDFVDSVVSEHHEYLEVLADVCHLFDDFYDLFLVAAATAGEDHAFGEEEGADLFETVGSTPAVAHQAASHRARLATDADVFSVLEEGWVEYPQIDVTDPKPENVKQVAEAGRGDH